jgi:hypothetical protein
MLRVPDLPTRLRSAYISGKEVFPAPLFGLLTLVYLRGTQDVAQGELMCFVA